VYEFCQVLVFVVVIGVYSGITVICVELFAAFCGGLDFTIGLKIPYWIAVGVLIAAFLFFIGILITFSTEILRDSPH